MDGWLDVIDPAREIVTFCYICWDENRQMCWLKQKKSVTFSGKTSMPTYIYKLWYRHWLEKITFLAIVACLQNIKAVT